MTSSKSVGLKSFEVIFKTSEQGDEEIALSFPNISLDYSSMSAGYKFNYIRPITSEKERKESKEIEGTLLEFFDDVKIQDDKFEFGFDAQDITGHSLIRRGEFGDIYLLIIKSSKTKDARINILVAKNDPNGDELYEILTQICKVKTERVHQVKNLKSGVRDYRSLAKETVEEVVESIVEYVKNVYDYYSS
eukprot:CAMPEP_0170514008 /NCGR_PEP_ID=MMETSP0209-20121228/569_1 /TAXON_ID=665100 ORGANISM="Litonotus pictus, Strain P1" /NCGR_SAMPLE_ID=MMETSP0209 /ASSEMBLY_ACC=CAM_ASM_000301 /LENGTH=190 /DNA_ID=CAMNT_0010797903 /DNA_START=36 /DNA_END=608 /DNA_ORIENTATION=+